MGQKINLQISDKASEKLVRISKQLGISRDELATICFEYVDVQHKGIVMAVKKLKQQKRNSTAKKKVVKKKDLSKHLNQLSAEQIEMLLIKAAQKGEDG